MSRESDIQVVALLRYADSCPPEALHPDCPFAVVADDGARTCNQECRTVLIRRMRPGFRSPAAFAGGDSAFDARQLLLSEFGPVPDAHWHTASLMQRLERAASYPPFDLDGTPNLRRDIDVTNSLAFLGQRGFDIDALLRHGLGDRLRTGITLWVSRLLRRGALEHDLDSNTAAWLGAMKEAVSGDGADKSLGEVIAVAMQGGFDEYINQWLSKAPLTALIGWEYRSPAELVTYQDVDGDVAAAVWVADRFIHTYLQQWSEESLRCEYRYLQGEIPPDVDADELALRPMHELTLAREISRRSVEGSTSSQRLDRVKLQAVARLRAGLHEEAAALFDAARTLEPQNSEAHNNFGFCMMPEDPGAALTALARSEALESDVFPINRMNQALAHLLLGDLDSAQRCAASAFDQRKQISSTGWLWDEYQALVPSDLSLSLCKPLDYLCRLGEFISMQQSDEREAERWRRRMAADN